MKGCIVLQGNNAKISHAIALELKNKYGVTNFCGYVYSEYSKNFIKSQSDIKYSPLLVDHELHKDFEKIKIDFEYLKNLEEKSDEKNLWSFFYSDRMLLLSIPPKDEFGNTDIKSMYSYENLLKIFISRAKPIEKMLDEEKPDFILFFTVGTIAHQILYNFAKQRGIKTLVIQNSRLGNKMTVSEDYNTITGIEELFHNPEKIEDNHKEEAKKIIENFKNTGSLNLGYLKNFIKNRIQKRRTGIKKIYKSIKWLIQLTKNYHAEKKLFMYGFGSQNPILFIKYKLIRKLRSLTNYNKLYSQPKDGENFAFYPLHLEPEMAILTFAHYYINQIALIEQIARSLPIDMKLYIKDHPTMVGSREKKYYNKLLQIPNVRLINPKTKSFEIIKKSSLLITTTSTAGLEAILLNKPVISFGNVFYNMYPTVKKATEIEKLYTLIKSQLNNNNYSYERLVEFTASVLQDSVDAQLHTLWYEENFEKIKNDTGLKNFAKLIADKVKK